MRFLAAAALTVSLVAAAYVPKGLAETTVRVGWCANTVSGGASPFEIERARRLVATRVGANGAGRRLTTSLALLLPSGKDPGVSLRLGLLSAWRGACVSFGTRQRRSSITRGFSPVPS